MVAQTLYNGTPHLLDHRGRPIPRSEDGLLLPHYKQFNAIVNAVSRTYPWRFDEALYDDPELAKKIRRDGFVDSCLQERYLPVCQAEWEVKPETEKHPGQKSICDELRKIVEQTPEWEKMLYALSEAVWFGRYGVQVQWGEVEVEGRKRMGVVKWAPVHGDKLVHGWDGTPRVFVNHEVYDDPRAEIVHTDRYPALLLDNPYWRQRFVIHRHLRLDAPFEDVHFAGQVGGVGLRHQCYHNLVLRTDMIGWAGDFLQKAAMGGLLLFFYPEGNDQDKQRAEAAAREASHRTALTVAVPPGDFKPQSAVQHIAFSVAGIEALREFIVDWSQRTVERLIVGQSMSAGADADDGLGGTGRAALTKDTKYQLLRFDARNLSGTLTTDLLRIIHHWNFVAVPNPLPYARFRPTLSLKLPDPAAGEKLEAASKVIEMGVTVRTQDVRDAAGFTAPQPGDETVGGQAAVPGAAPGAPGQPPGGGQPPSNGPPPNGQPAPRPSPPQPAAPAQYAFDPDEPRDDAGKWTKGAGGEGEDSEESSNAVQDWKKNGVRSKAFKAWFGDWEDDPANASKVVKADGSPETTHSVPIPVYHGTRSEFDAFESNRGGAFFFTASHDAAVGYSRRYSGVNNLKAETDALREKLKAQGIGRFEILKHPEWKEHEKRVSQAGARVVSAYLAVKNPFVMDGANDPDDLVNKIKDDPKEIAKLKKQGYDGLLIRNALDRPIAVTKEDAELTQARADVWAAFEPHQIKSVDNRGTFDPGDANLKYAFNAAPLPYSHLPDEDEDDESDEDAAERASLLAEFLAQLFGLDADAAFEDEQPTAYTAYAAWLVQYAWNPADHPRGAGGRFVLKGTPEAYSHATRHVKAALGSKKHSREAVEEVLTHLNNLTTKQLHALKREHGISASGATKEALRAKLADRLSRGRRDVMEPEKPAGKVEEEQALKDAINARGERLRELDRAWSAKLPEDERQAIYAEQNKLRAENKRDVARLNAVQDAKRNAASPESGEKLITPTVADPLDLTPANVKAAWEKARDEIANHDPKMSPAQAGSIAAARILNAVGKRANEYIGEIDARVRAGGDVTPEEDERYIAASDARKNLAHPLATLSGYRPHPEVDAHPLANRPLDAEPLPSVAAAKQVEAEQLQQQAEAVGVAAEARRLKLEPVKGRIDWDGTLVADDTGEKTFYRDTEGTLHASVNAYKTKQKAAREQEKAKQETEAKDAESQAKQSATEQAIEDRHQRTKDNAETVSRHFDARLRAELKKAGYGALLKKAKYKVGGTTLPAEAPPEALAIREKLLGQYTGYKLTDHPDEIASKLAALDAPAPPPAAPEPVGAKEPPAAAKPAGKPAPDVGRKVHDFVLARFTDETYNPATAYLSVDLAIKSKRRTAELAKQAGVSPDEFRAAVGHWLQHGEPMGGEKPAKPAPAHAALSGPTLRQHSAAHGLPAAESDDDGTIKARLDAVAEHEGPAKATPEQVLAALKAVHARPRGTVAGGSGDKHQAPTVAELRRELTKTVGAGAGHPRNLDGVLRDLVRSGKVDGYPASMADRLGDDKHQSMRTATGRMDYVEPKETPAKEPAIATRDKFTPKPSTAKVSADEAKEQMRSLWGRFSDPNLTKEEIGSTIFGMAHLPVSQLNTMAKEIIGIDPISAPKQKVLDRIAKQIYDRKGLWERSQA